MKNITLSADARLIERARARARARKTTLNHLFRDWLHEIAGEAERTEQIDKLFERLESVNSGGRFSREEMNAR